MKMGEAPCVFNCLLIFSQRDKKNRKKEKHNPIRRDGFMCLRLGHACGLFTLLPKQTYLLNINHEVLKSQFHSISERTGMKRKGIAAKMVGGKE